MTRLAGMVATLTALLSAAPAARATEGEKAFSVGLSYAHFRLSDDLAPHGGTLGADFEYGLSDSFALRVSAAAGAYHDGSALYSGHAVAGITYLFDVLEWVPYANLGVGGIVIDGPDAEAAVEPLIELGIGLDVLQSRSHSWGFVARYETYTTRTHLVMLGARMTWRWGLF